MPKRKEGGPKKPSKTVPGEAGDLQSKENGNSAEGVTDRPSEAKPIAPQPQAPSESKQQKLVSPYRVVFKSAALGFELGEDSQYRQRVFRFHEKPGDEVIAALKENGFKYRPQEKAWTVQASFASRAVSDNLARQFAEGAVDRPR